MKKHGYSQLVIYRRSQPVTPNAADNRYFSKKAVDILTAVISMLGFASAMLFLLTL